MPVDYTLTMGVRMDARTDRMRNDAGHFVRLLEHEVAAAAVDTMTGHCKRQKDCVEIYTSSKSGNSAASDPHTHTHAHLPIDWCRSTINI